MGKPNIPKEMEKLNTHKEIERLIHEYGNDVLRTSYLYLKDMKKAEDVFQEVFIKVYKNYEKFKGKSSEKTWILRITINSCKDMLRSSWFKRVFISEVPEADDNFEVDTAEVTAIKHIENKILFNEVLALPAVLKDVVILYYYQEFDTNEISKILRVPQGTVRSRLHRARESLRKKLKGRIEHYE